MPTTAPLLEPRVFEVLEQTSGRLSGTLTDNDGVTPVPGAALVTLTLTLYVVKADGTTGIVNSRNAQNVLNQNNVTVDSAGLLVWLYQVGDTTLIEALPFERHIALFTWTTATTTGRTRVVLNVQNLLTVT